jgi:hypothetical protein
MSASPTESDSFHRSLDRALAVHVIVCASCRSDNVEGAPNSQGHWYGHCLTCGTRFWAREPHKHP